MFSWNFWWGWVNLWGEVRAKFRSRRHTQNHFFNFRRQINHRAGTSNSRRLLFRSSIPSIPDAFALRWEQIEWVLMMSVARISMNCIRWRFQILQRRSSSSHMFNSISISCFFSLLLSFRIYIYALSMHHWALSGLDWVLLHDNLEVTGGGMDPLLTDAHERLNWYVLHFHT